MLRSAIESQVAVALNRTDLASQIPFWFNIAYDDLQKLRNWKEQEVTVKQTLVLDVSTYDIPSGIKEPYVVYLYDPTSKKVVKFFTPTDIATVRARRIEADPDAPFTQQVILGQTVMGNALAAIWACTLEIWPTPGPAEAGRDIRIDCYRFLDPPASDASDFFTDHAGDYLLYRSLMESAPYLADDPRLQIWSNLMQRAETRIVGVDVSATYAGPLVMRG